MNNATQAEHRFPRRRRRWKIAVIGLAVVAASMCALVFLTGPEHLESDEIVRECGTYLSPGRNYLLIVSEADDGMTDIRFEPVGNLKDRLLRFWSRLRGEPVPQGSKVAANQEWFACFDEFDRQWVFFGRGDPNNHPPQSVFMFGFYFNSNGLTNGAQIVSYTGDWKGVPPRFFEAIPAKDDRAAWEDAPPIPAVPPQFSESERQAVASRRR